MSVATQRGMTGVLKKFNPASHRKNDPVAKAAFLKYLKETMPEFEHIENPDEHGIDLLTLDNGKVIACWELERREKHWVGDIEFPKKFDPINCWERKDHQWRRAPTFTEHITIPLADNYSVCYVQMNNLCTRVAIIDGDIILQHALKEHPNVNVSSGEYVRQVPLSKVQQVKIA